MVYEEGEIYVLNSDNLEFISAFFSTTARGEELYSCSWNKEESVCLDEWKFIKEVNPRENFEQEILSGAVAYKYETIKQLTISGDLGIAAAINGTNADGVVVYSELAVHTPRYRSWNSSSNDFSAELTDTSDTGGDIWWTVVKSSVTRDEMLVGTENDAQQIHIQTYNSSSSWGNLLQVSAGVPNSALRAFDIAYEQSSGDGLIVYENDGANTNAIFAYRTWDGTNYSTELTYDTGITTNAFQWVKLTPKANSDNIMILVHNGASELYAVEWNGTGMKTTTAGAVSIATTSGSEQHFDFAWEGSSGQGLFIFGVGTDIIYKTYDPVGGIGGADNPITLGNGNGLDAARACGAPSSDDIGFIWQDAGNDVNVAMWDGDAVLAGSPAEDGATEANGGNNVPVDCVWVNDSTAIFGFVDLNALSVDYFTFENGGNTWSTSALTSTSNTGNFASDDIKGMRFVKNPVSEEVMVTAEDIADDLSATRWDGSSFVNPTAYNLETTIESNSGTQ